MRLRNFCRKAIPLGRGNCIVVVHGGLNERVCRDESDDNILVPKGSLIRLERLSAKRSLRERQG